MRIINRAIYGAQMAGYRTLARNRDFTILWIGTFVLDRTKYGRISALNPSIDPNAKLQKGDKVTVP